MTNDDKLLTIKQAADKLGVHWQTIRNYIKSGRIKAIKIGKNVRILESKLIAAEECDNEEHEIEIRFATKNRKIIEKKLIEMGAKVIYQGHIIDHWYVPNSIKDIKQKDEWFDSGAGYGLRIREQDNGYSGKITSTLEVKRLLIPHLHDTCLEQEIDAPNYQETNRLLNLINHKEFNTLEKDRLVYKYKEYKIVIDDIKNFITGVEIELITNKDRQIIVPKLKKIAEDIGLDTTKEMTNKSVTFLFMMKFSKF